MGMTVIVHQAGHGGADYPGTAHVEVVDGHGKRLVGVDVYQDCLGDNGMKVKLSVASGVQVLEMRS